MRINADKVIDKAGSLKNTPLPQISDSLYREFSLTGNRTHWETVSFQRRGRIKWYVLAECLEMNKRFLASFKELALSLCSEKTWVMPAHDKNLNNFYGKRTDIDLGSAILSCDLACAAAILKPVLDSKLYNRIYNEIRARVLNPFIRMVNGETK